MPAHRAGGKLTRSHTTLIDAAVAVVDHLQDQAEVSKISLGLIKSVGKGSTGLKFHAVTGGWRIVVRGSTSLQELVVYTRDPLRTQAELLRLSAARG